MKILLSSLILLSALSSPSAFANQDTQTAKPACMDIFKLCVEIRKSIVRDMMDHNKSGANTGFLMPSYTDYDCALNLAEKEETGQCE